MTDRREQEKLAAAFAAIIGKEHVTTDVPLSAHTTFRIGGPADFFLIPQSEEQVGELLRFCRREGIASAVIGNGSNLLVSDEGFRGAVILMDHNLQAVEISGGEISAQAGALLAGIARAAAERSLTGLEFAGGIPGTLGGAIVMNAGAYGGEMRDVLVDVRALDPDLSPVTLEVGELALSYRTSRIKEEGFVVLGARLRLAPGDPDKIVARMDELREARASKQPLQYPSAGSTFQRPPGQFAGKLIMEAGLAGTSVGDAAVSEKHCGFLINRGAATAADVLRLIRLVQERVRENAGVELVPEVRFLGDFSYVE